MTRLRVKAFTATAGLIAKVYAGGPSANPAESGGELTMALLTKPSKRITM